ncbi:MAG: response regulator, partial [Bacteroidales bacterium]|nr:response regulator [Bacteroidales bacterium]
KIINSVEKENDSVFWVSVIGNGVDRLVINNTADSLGIAEYSADNYSIKNGLHSNDIKKTIIDNDGNIWFIGNGISRLNKNDGTITNFPLNIEPHDYTVNSNAIKKIRGGLIIYGGFGGFTYFNPSEIKVDTTKPNTVITGMQVNKTPYHNTHHINNKKLKHNQNDIDINFTSFDYPNVKNVKYRYVLENFDSDWKFTDFGHNKVSYKNLSAGSYHFKVYGTNGDGIWSEQYADLQFKIFRPWWLSIVATGVYSVLLLLLLYAGYFYISRYYRVASSLEIKKINEQKLAEIHQSKLQFFTNISHEFRTPLTLIQAPLQLIKNSDFAQDVSRKYLPVIQRNADSLLKLVNEILEFRKVESGNAELKTELCNIQNLVTELIDLFRVMAQQKNIQINLSCELSSKEYLLDKEKVSKIINNFLSNSLKNTKSNGKIHIYISDKEITQNPGLVHKYEILSNNFPLNQYLEIAVEDNGVGISGNSLKFIFDRFYQSSNHKNSSPYSTGIGLAVVKNLVMLHRGELRVFSSENIGTRFSMRLPLNNIFNNAEISTNNVIQGIKDQKTGISTSKSITRQPGDKSHSLLIVDDNEDMLMLLEDHFRHEFKITKATNGKQALCLISKKLPDIIISDVMMPEMSGMELCHHIKSNSKTNHIPVILLTAKTSLESTIKGFDKGADMYVSKPFNISLLKSQVKSILFNRHNFRLKHNKNLLPETEFKTTNNQDEEFISCMLKIIKENIQNPELDVNFLTSHLGMSRTSLLLKTKSITDRSPNDLIRTIRLNYAKHLLKTSNLNTAEISFQCGFTSPSYFIKRFKEKYNCTPSQYVKQAHNITKEEEEQDSINLE